MMYSDDEDDNEFDDDRSEELMFDDWFWDYQSFFHPGLKQGNEPKPMVAYFYSGIYKRIMSDISPKVRQVAYKYYPVLADETRPEVCQLRDKRLNKVGCRFLIQLFGLMFDEQLKTNLKEKYPDLEDWRRKYARPYDPLEVWNPIFENAPWLTEAQKQELIDEEAEEISWKEEHQRDFFDMLQQSVLEHYPQVENLSADGWIVYAFLLHVEHADYRFDIEFVADFIECGLTVGDLDLPITEIHDKIRLYYNEKFNSLSPINDDGNSNCV